MGDFAEFFSSLVSAVIAVYSWTRSNWQLKRYFHCPLNWKNSFPSISQPLSGTQSGQLIQGLFLLLLRPCYATWGFLLLYTPDWEMGILQNHPLAPWCLWGRLYVHIYSVSTPLVIIVIALIADLFYFFLLLCERNQGMCLGQNM